MSFKKKISLIDLKCTKLSFSAFLALSISAPFFFNNPSKADNLINEFQSQESATWDNAQYESVTKSLSGEELIIRYFIDKNSKIYKFSKGTKYSYGPTLIGNLKEKSYLDGNTCLFGTNYECLSNVTRTTSQYLVKDGKLFEFSRTEYLKSGTKGDVNKKVLGGPIINRELAKKYFDRGINKYDAQDYAGSINEFTKTIEIDPDNENAYFYRGTANYYLDNFVSSNNDLNKLIKINPKDSDAYFYRGINKFSLNDYDGSIKDLNKSIEMNPKFGYQYFMRGTIKYELNDKSGACFDMKQSRDLGYNPSPEFIDICKL